MILISWLKDKVLIKVIFHIINFQKAKACRVHEQPLLYNRTEYLSVVSTFIGVTLYVETPVIGVELLFSAV